MSEKDKERYHSRKNAKLCTQCGKNSPLPNKVRCNICAERQHINQKIYGAKRWKDNKEQEYLKSRDYKFKRWGISYDEWLVQITNQDWRCGNEYCRKILSLGKGQFATDHDHITNKFRGILCASCNIILGHAKDTKEILKGLIKYLENV